MKKSIKILLLIIVAFLFISSRCFAVNIEMNLTNNTAVASSNELLSVDNTASNSTTSNNVLAPNGSNSDSNTLTNAEVNSDAATNSDLSNATLSGSTQSNTESSANVSNLSALPESDLGLTNILNIILIAIGFILILLAIAILIRLSSK